MTLTTAERAAQMSLADKIKLFSELAPLIVMVQQIAVASDERQRALLILDAMQFLAGKTRTADDDEALELLEGVLRSNEGTALFAWMLKKFGG